MKLFRATVLITGLGGIEDRSFEIEAKTLKSAEKKLIQKMGNQNWDLVEFVEVRE